MKLTRPYTRRMSQAPVSARIDAALERARYIRAIGPTTDDFMRWRDEVDELLADLIGEEHPAMKRYREAIGATGQMDAEGLQIHGPYGMAPRLERAEAVLRELISRP